MTGIAMDRKRTLLVGAGVLLLLAIVALVLGRNTQASAGALRHDDTLRTVEIDETWQVERPRHGLCFTVGFTGEVSGNARNTWGLTGPATVWENLRSRPHHALVKAKELGPDGACTGRATMDSTVVTLSWRTGDGARRGDSQTRVVSGKGSSTWNGYRDTTVRIDGGAYDRDESYRTTLAVSVEPSWRIEGGTTSDLFQVEHTIELPAAG